MKQTTPESCPRCGAPLPAASDDDLCPACLLSGALKQPEGEDETLPMQPGQTRSSPPRPVPVSTGTATAPFEEPSDFPCAFGDYRLLGLLGRGGMGSVYEAEQLATGRRLALKVLGTQLDNPEMRQRFLREGRLAASVSHPNSLYIYGTEEIEGIPVITMEIAAGGTLSDRLRKEGPMPVTDAVDAILDVIAGLEAAFAGGVLHRDVKPSNCFVSPDRSVKVGDFGLSVSTTAQVDSFLTATGVIMGTPAYAPPEQLRGRDLDVRTDIYSVGATLYTLLANRPPIEGQNAVQIVAAALDEKPESLAEVNEDIPAGLAQVVARCLAKKPAQRFSDYASLRNALLPFSSAQPEPAPLGRRFLAGFIDEALINLIPVTLLFVLFGIDLDEDSLLGERTTLQVGAWIGVTLLGLVYYGIFEGIRGTGIGKALIGIRVIRTGGRTPGLGRAFLRAAIIAVMSLIGKLVGFVAYTIETYDWTAEIVIGSLSAVFLLGFVTIRRRNGFATVWDLATGTRVVVRPTGAERPVVEVEEAPDLSMEGATLIGPYPVIDRISSGNWVTAYDPTLRRRVWLRRRTGSELPLARRDLARPGRHRWLQSVKTEEATWDVFEFQAGVPLRHFLDGDEPLSWESMRHWLYDLASEIAAASKDGTLPPELSFDHVWITGQGRAILLDEPMLKHTEEAQRFPVDDLAGQQRFLHSLAECVSPTTIPLHARAVLQSLGAGSFEKLSFLAGNLRSLLAKPVRLDRQYRATSLLAVPVFVVLMLCAGALRLMVSELVEIEADLRIPPAAGQDELSPDDPLLELDIDPDAWQAAIEDFSVASVAGYTLAFIGMMFSALLAVTQLFSVLAFRGTLGQFAFGFAVVDAKGSPAGRPRLLLRWFAAWCVPSAFLILLNSIIEDSFYSITDFENPVVWALIAVFASGWFIGLAAAIFRPTRGWQDRLTGCWLVRR